MSAPEPDQAAFEAALHAFEGRPVGPPTEAPDPVNQAMIRHWVEAMGDENPVYTDEEAARRSGFAGVIAPPTMLQAWVMRGYRASVQAEAARAGSGAGAGNAQDELLGRLDQAGFTSVVATNCEQRYRRPLVLGDRLTVSSVIESVSGRKTTALGEGHFVTTRLDFTDAAGEPVATMRFRILKFRPRTDAGPRARRPRPAVTEDLAFFFDGAAEGRVLVQRCDGCGTLRHPPLPSCPRCRSLAWTPHPVAGTGAVYSYVVVHHPQVAAFDYPLPIALVELDEGVRMVGDLVDVAPADVHIGMRVRAETVATDDELTLVMFRPEGGD